MVREKLDFGKLTQLIWCITGGGMGTAALTAQLAWAQPNEISSTTAIPVVTATTPSQAGLTVPSLWWAREQFGGKLLDSWIAYPSRDNTPSYIDLLVHRDVWNLLDYLERYTFVNQFGFTASDYGYNLRVFDRQKNLLATYTCNFSRANPDYLEGVRDFQGQPVPNYVSGHTTSSGSQNPKELVCQMGLKPSSIVTLKRRPSQSPGFSATGPGTGQP
jgi:hypothetical protein